MLSNIRKWFTSLVGNNRAATVGIFIFIGILLLCMARCAKADELDVSVGASFGHSFGPVLGVDYYHPISGLKDVRFYAGTMLWGSGLKNYQTNNWDWHSGLEACHKRFCASIGAAYVQKIDDLNGSHTNFNLQLAYKFGGRLSEFKIVHLSNAGTTSDNIGRQAAVVGIKLQ